MTRQPTGFTLLELLVAMTVTGMALLIAHALFSAIERTGARMKEEHQAEEQADVGRTWLEEVFRWTEIGRPGDGSFDGDSETVTFTTYMRTPAGWTERHRVTIGATAGRLVLSDGSRDTIELRHPVTGVGFDYLLEPGAQSRWVAAWHSPVSAPLGVRMRIADSAGVDTLLLRIGTRG
jgi:prepilin-type N-terminal cleavage/methylation domain-containing protein